MLNPLHTTSPSLSCLVNRRLTNLVHHWDRHVELKHKCQQRQVKISRWRVFTLLLIRLPYFPYYKKQCCHILKSRGNQIACACFDGQIISEFSEWRELIVPRINNVNLRKIMFASLVEILFFFSRSFGCFNDIFLFFTNERWSSQELRDVWISRMVFFTDVHGM
jgi:hypothetical protein